MSETRIYVIVYAIGLKPAFVDPPEPLAIQNNIISMYFIKKAILTQHEAPEEYMHHLQRPSLLPSIGCCTSGRFISSGHYAAAAAPSAAAVPAGCCI